MYNVQTAQLRRPDVIKESLQVCRQSRLSCGIIEVLESKKTNSSSSHYRLEILILIIDFNPL